MYWSLTLHLLVASLLLFLNVYLDWVKTVSWHVHGTCSDCNLWSGGYISCLGKNVCGSSGSTAVTWIQFQWNLSKVVPLLAACVRTTFVTWLIQGHGRVQIFSGHLHFPWMWIWAFAILFTANALPFTKLMHKLFFQICYLHAVETLLEPVCGFFSF